MFPSMYLVTRLLWGIVQKGAQRMATSFFPEVTDSSIPLAYIKLLKICLNGFIDVKFNRLIRRESVPILTHQVLIDPTTTSAPSI